MIEKCLDEVKVYVSLMTVRTSGAIYATEDLQSQEMGDQLKDVQTLQNTLLRAARLTRMKNTMDLVSPEEELFLMMADHAKIATAASLGASSVKNGGGQISRVVEHNLIRDAEMYTEFEEATNGNHTMLLERLSGAIDEATYIRQQMSLLEGEDMREIYLQRFLACSLNGVRRWIANRILFEHIETEEESSGKSNRRIVVLIFIPLYFCFVSLYIFLFGVSIGPKSTNLWLIGCLQAFLMDIILLQPCKIWMQRIAIASFAGVHIQRQHEVLRDRSISIMKRCDGLMKYSSALVQHFNPACRAARFFPELPAARLLISLSDYDLPLNKFTVTNPTLLDQVSDLFTYMGMAVLIALVVLPEVVQESGIEIFVTGAVNCSFLVAYYMSKLFVAVPVVLFFLMVGFLFYQNQQALKRYSEEKQHHQAEMRTKAEILLRTAAAGDGVDLSDWKERVNSSLVMGNVMRGLDKKRSLEHHRVENVAVPVPASTSLVGFDTMEWHAESEKEKGDMDMAIQDLGSSSRSRQGPPQGGKPNGPPPAGSGPPSGIAPNSEGVSFYNRKGGAPAAPPELERQPPAAGTLSRTSQISANTAGVSFFKMKSSPNE